mmetsp:Transcript_8326/g.18183  ORF Transcript_8326/g.18183 Transcript_8326/m.18183 type:complete len:364 (-) Transcript_8326:84-1175(-)|eukprot:CAMPEP_0170622500 /NCGR_PEP_ID=MMETSP0224-20130122/29167_1 /TAXON_ID=285029 /ORGANISM="Togula jolla, Strain CCCM 725" /LENGTH=363 /DNA_ID=CAMNT_0010948829 /DNA_START=43 /DNA_END=1134 /DNA_ORIENTATION=+
MARHSALHALLILQVFILHVSALNGNALLLRRAESNLTRQNHNDSTVDFLDLEERLVSEASGPACQAEPDSSTRVILRVVVPNNHGSTAMEATLMSSTNLATLCASNVWQCEGHKLLEQLGHGTVMEELDTSLWLKTFSKHWNLEKPVLLDKKTKWMSLAINEDRPLVEATPPQAMQSMGIRSLQTAYVIMYKPICLWSLSHFVVDHIKNKPRVHARRELDELEEQVQLHKYLRSEGRPVVVVNYADLVWNSDFTKKRLESFLPCLGSLDMDYVPKLGVDVFPGNNMKVSTGVKTYGQQSDPIDCCNYQLPEPELRMKGRCMRDDEWPNEGVSFRGGLDQFLDKERQRRLAKATHYLDRFSQV